MTSDDDFAVDVPDLADIEADYAARANGHGSYATIDEPVPLPDFDYSARLPGLPEREPAAATAAVLSPIGHTPRNEAQAREVVIVAGDAQLAKDVSATSTLPNLELAKVERLSLRGLDTYNIRRVEWLDRPFYQRAAFHLLAGRKGTCKGTHLCGLAARVSRGDLYEEPKRVLVITSEDSIELDFLPRVVAANGDPSMVTIVSGSFLMPADIPWLKEQARQLGNVGLIVIDPIGNHLGGADTDKEGLVRAGISPLNPLADELDCMIVGVRHLGKDSSRGALASVLGSTAWVDVPRCVILMAADDEDELLFHAQVVTGNRGPKKNTGRAYRLQLVDVPPAAEITLTVLEGDSTKDVEELLGANPGATAPASKSAKARELILDILDNEGEQESDALDARIARETGISAKTARNLRSGLSKDEGLIGSRADKSEGGTVDRWLVYRTLAPRANP